MTRLTSRLVLGILGASVVAGVLVAKFVGNGGEGRPHTTPEPIIAVGGPEPLAVPVGEDFPSQLSAPSAAAGDHGYDSKVYESAQRIAETLSAGATVRTCEAVRADIVQFARLVSKDLRLLQWGIGRAEACLPMLAGLEEQREFLESLVQAAPESGRLLELLGRQYLFLGRAEDAVTAMQASLAVKETPGTWDLLAGANLSMARTASESDARSLLEEADAALRRALALSGQKPDPWTLARMAEVQLAQGNQSEAIIWADRAISAIRSGAVTNAVASLYMKVGDIHYRAGMPETGIAYMDHAINVAPTTEQREQYRAMKDAAQKATAR